MKPLISTANTSLVSAHAAARRLRLISWVLAGAALIVGFGLGILVMRHRRDAQKVIAAVNGTVITQDQFFSRLQQAAGQAVMHKMVEEQLQMQFAQKKGLAPTDAQVEEKYRLASKDSKFIAELNASGMGVGDYKQNLRVQLAQTNVLTQNVTVSDAEIRDFYRAQSDPRNPSAQFYRPETVTLRVIACPTSQAAQKVMQELAANTPFEIVASEYSMDASKTNGGLINPIQRGRSPLAPLPNVEQAVFGLKIGQLYGPVNFNKGWWIFRCEDKSPAQTLPFDRVKEECRTGALVIKGTRLNGKNAQAEFQQFQGQSNLQAFWPQYMRAVTGR